MALPKTDDLTSSEEAQAMLAKSVRQK